MDLKIGGKISKYVDSETLAKNQMRLKITRQSMKAKG